MDAIKKEKIKAVVCGREIKEKYICKCVQIRYRKKEREGGYVVCGREMKEKKYLQMCANKIQKKRETRWLCGVRPRNERKKIFANVCK